MSTTTRPDRTEVEAQLAAAAASGADARSWTSHVEEFGAVRAATVKD